MKQRCYNKNLKSHKYYYDKGIIICDEWLKDKSKFYKWAIKNGFHKKNFKNYLLYFFDKLSAFIPYGSFCFNLLAQA